MVHESFPITSKHIRPSSWLNFHSGQYFRSADYTGRIAKWGTVLGAFDIIYMPRTSIKGQVLVDMVAEFAESFLEEVAPTQNMDEKSVGTISLQEPLF